MKLQTALEALYGLERRKDKLGLDGTRALLRALGDPHTRFRSVHVAGTNGKGSVCALVERVLRAAGHRTGLYTSPHLVDFRERIRVAGEWADEDRLAERLDHIQALPEGSDRTFFEVATALAFDDFATRGVEVAVVEVGLGGRLDCTNVLAPDATVITSIGLDHTEILGDTIQKIAFEKAGIVKRGVPLIVNAAIEPAAMDVIEAVARERRAAIVRARPAIVDGERVRIEATPWGALDVRVGIPGTMLHENAGVAAATLATLAGKGLAVDEAAMREGFGAARWPGRFEACPTEPRLVWDGAHNEQGVAALAGAGPFGAVVVALSRDKDAHAMLSRLAGLRPAELVVTRSRQGRAAEPDALAAQARAIGWDAHVQPDVPSAVRFALGRTRGAGDGRDRVLLTGSLFAVGEAMEVFGGAPGAMQ